MTHSRCLGAIAAVLGLVFLPLVSFAAEFRAGNQPSFSAEETVVGDLYMAGGNVTVGGSARGDLVVAGGSLLLNGPVSADLIAGGGNITILGDVGDDVRGAGGNIVIQGKVGGDVVLGGGQINLAGPSIAGDVALGGGSIRIDSPVTGSVKIGGGDVYINAPIGGNLNIQAEKITLGPKAIIAGDFSYSSSNEATLEEGAVVRGKTTFTEFKGVDDIGKIGFIALLSLGLVTKFFLALVGAFALTLIFRRFSETLVRTAAARPFFEMGRGFIFLIMAPIASVILLFTVIGVPLGLLGLIAFVGSLLFVSIATPVVLGSMVYRFVFKGVDYEISWKTIFLGAALYALLGLIPIIGWLLKFAIILLTLGAALNIKWRALEDWR